MHIVYPVLVVFIFGCGRFHQSPFVLQSGSCDPQGIPFGGGKGLQSDPFLVCQNSQWNALKTLGNTVNWVSLRDDIDAASEPLEMIPDWPGHLEGNFHAVLNHSASLPLFDGIQGSIKNLFVDHVSIESQSEEVGALARRVENGGEIENISVIGSVTSTLNYVGGVVGRNFGILTNIMFDGEVSGRSKVGGIAGANFGVLNRVGSAGMVGGSLDDVGGLLGFQQGGKLLLGTGEALTSGMNNVGGIIGLSQDARIENSYAKSIVNGTSQIGGLIGSVLESVLFFCYASTDLNASVGVSGGLVGVMSGGGVTSSYWDLSKHLSSAAGEGRLPSELKLQSTFVDWDFNVIWLIGKDGMPDLY